MELNLRIETDVNWMFKLDRERTEIQCSLLS